MRRWDIAKGVGVGLATTAAASCAQEESAQPTATTASPASRLKWKMVTTWPKNFPRLGTGAEYLARAINALSGGRIEVTVYGGGELVPAFEVFDPVSNGTAEMGHGGAYYWKGKAAATQLFGAVPFGMTATEMDGWLSYGGGLALWREIYARFNLRPNPAGHTGVQMGGYV